MYNLRIKRQKIATVSRAMVKDIFINKGKNAHAKK
jgi:hypothetical protein